MSSKLYLAFCKENKSVADEIAQHLGRANYSFLPLSSEMTKESESMTFLIAGAKVPGLLLLSDNFLKDETCMQNMLSFIQTSAAAEQMQIVVIDGQDASGKVPTSFDRVSNVIQYMNYWQEKYLEMRKQKRTIKAADEEIFNLKLQTVKDVSSQIGDFLRLVRNKDFWTYDQMIFNNYEIFFKKYGTPAQHQTFSGINPSPSSKVLEEKVVAAPIINEVQTPTPAPTVNEVVAPTSVTEEVMPPTPTPIPVAQNEIKEETSSSTIFIPKMIRPGTKTATETNKIPSIVDEKVAEIPTSAEELKTISEQITPNIPKSQTVHERVMEMQSNISSVNPLEEEEQEIDEILDEMHASSTEDIIQSLDQVEASSPDSHDELESVFSTESEPQFEIPEKEIVIEDVIIDEDEEEEFDPMEGMEITDDVEEEFSSIEDIESNEEYEETEEIEEIEELTEVDIYGEEQIEELDIDFEEEIEEETIPDISPKVSSVANLGFSLEMANSFMSNGSHEEGSKAFEELIESNPSNIDIQYEYAAALKTQVNNIDKAAIVYENILKQDPNHLGALKALAEIAEYNNDFQLAKHYYEKLINVNPDEPGVNFKLALITIGFFSDEAETAGKYFKNAIDEDPDNEEAHYRYGVLLSDKLEEPQKALNHFSKCLEINPSHPFANFQIALLHNQLGDKTMAAQLYAEAWHKNPELRTPENDELFKNTVPVTIESPVAEEITEVPPVIEEEKVVLITGATSGIGKATATKFAAQGYRVILTGRRDDRLIKMKDAFEKEYSKPVKILPFDVRNLEEVKTMIDSLEEEWKDIDILINNAGLAKGFDPIQSGNIDHWDTMIDTNIKGLLYLTRAVSPNMVARRSGHIINVCSTAGKEVYPKGNVYCATKHAVDALTKAMRVDLHKHNVRVGQVSPGHVEETEFAYVRFEDKEKAKIYEDFKPLTSSDVADAIYYIATAPAHVNIQDILLTGTQQANSNFIDRSGRN